MSPPTLVKKVSDEGTTSPFMARLFLGILELRDQLFLMGLDQKEKTEKLHSFDRGFQPLFEAAQATRDSALEVISLIRGHTKAIEERVAARFRVNQYDILETIDVPLGQSVDKLIDQSVVATKTGLQKILRDPLGLEIGFLFQKENAFKDGIANLASSGENALAKYLREVRETWLSALIDLRNGHEHHGWTLEKLKYQIVDQSMLVVKLPVVLGLPVDAFAQFTANRVLLFIENMMVYALQRSCCDWYPIYVSEIPVEQRDPRNPQRFRLGARGLTELPPWEIKFLDNMDFI